MSRTTDRTIRDDRLLLVIIGMIIIVAVGGFFYWTLKISPDSARKEADQSLNSMVQPVFHNEPLAVTLYYPGDSMLVSSPAQVKRQPDLQAQARETLAAVFLDQRAMQAPVLRDVKLHAFFLGAQGTAYVDLMTVQGQPLRASAWDEQLAIYSLVNTLTKNFEEIRQVVLLMDGKEAPTLAGHMDLSRKFGKRMDLVKQ